MATYKIVASDLDGTLLTNEHVLSPENAKAISAMNALGVFFVPFTGRTLSEILPALRDNPDVRYICYSNGATILDKATGKKIEFVISNEKLNALFDVLTKYEVHYAVRHGGTCYCDASQMNDQAYSYYNLTSDHVDCVKTYSTPVKEFIPFARSLDSVEVVAMFFRHKDDLKKCQAEVLALGGLGAAGVSEYNLEVFNTDAGKGNSLQALANELNVPMPSVIAMGDSDNDVSMIKVAGLGLSTSNGNDNIKALADKVICSCDEHTAQYVLENFIK